MLTGCLVAAVLAAKLFPDTPTGAWLHRLLVEAPARWCASLRLRHVLFLVAAVGLAFSLGPVGSSPEVLLLAADMSVYLDALLAVAAVAALMGSRAAWTAVRAALADVCGRTAAVFGRSRGRTAPRRRRSPVTSTGGGDDPDPAWAVAFALA